MCDDLHMKDFYNDFFRAMCECTTYECRFAFGIAFSLSQLSLSLSLSPSPSQ